MHDLPTMASARMVRAQPRHEQELRESTDGFGGSRQVAVQPPGDMFSALTS